MKKYEIINPSDKCFIYAADERLAKIACAVLGNGWYGLKDENGETVISIMESLNDALGMTDEEIQRLIDENKIELSKVFLSIEYAYERTSLNDIESRSKAIGKALAERG